MDILIDFDGTVVTHDFPRIGKDIGAVPVLKSLVAEGHNLILFTMRDDVKNPTSDDMGITTLPGDYLSKAVWWFIKNGVPLYGVQANPKQKGWTNSPKAFGDLIIDDTALGVPLVHNPEYSERPYVDWDRVAEMLKERGIL